MQSKYQINLLFFCFNLFVVIMGSASFKWYDKVLEENTHSWIELRNYTNARSEVLSSQYLSFSRRNLSFGFLFYGTRINTVSVTTQGFVSMMGETYLQLYKTQYVAPLMANFFPGGQEPNQDVRIYQDDKIFIVQWSSMYLAEEEHAEDGYFTFQLHLCEDGTIRFLYREIPISVQDIVNHNHPVTVGISGAYRDTLQGKPNYVPYDTIHINKNNIRSGTTFSFKPRPTCVEQTSCSGCRLLSVHCDWCPTIQKCSTGNDSLKLEWDKATCPFLSQSQCEEELKPHMLTVQAPATSPPSTPDQKLPTIPIIENSTARADHVTDHVTEENETERRESKKQKADHTDMIVIKALLISTGAIVLLLIVATLLVKRFGWRQKTFISHVKLESKNCNCNEGGHMLLKVDEQST